MRGHLPRRPRLLRREARPLFRPRAAVGELRHQRDHAIAVPPFDRAAVHLTDLRDADRHALEQLLPVERRIEDLGDVEERARLLEPARRLREEPRVIERERRLRRERAQQGLRLRRHGHGGRPVRREDAEYALADGDRIDEAEPHAHVAQTLGDAVGQTRIGGARPEDRLAMLRHPSHRAFAHREVHGKAVGTAVVADDEGAHHAIPCLVHHPHADPRRVEEARRRRHDVLEHLVGVERRGHQAVDVIQRAQALRVLARFSVEARVADRDRRLVGEPCEDRLVLVGECARRAVVHVEQTFDTAVDLDRHRHRGHEALLAHERSVTLIHARILEVVARAERLARREDDAAHAFAWLDAQRVHAGAARPAVGTRHHGVGARLAQQDARDVSSAQLTRADRHALEHGVEVERRADRCAHLREHLRFATAPIRLRVESRIADGGTRLRQEALEQVVIVSIEAKGLATGEDDHREQVLVVHDRHGEQTAQPLRGDPVTVARQ